MTKIIQNPIHMFAKTESSLFTWPIEALKCWVLLRLSIIPNNLPIRPSWFGYAWLGFIRGATPHDIAKTEGRSHLLSELQVQWTCRVCAKKNSLDPGGLGRAMADTIPKGHNETRCCGKLTLKGLLSGPTNYQTYHHSARYDVWTRPFFKQLDKHKSGFVTPGKETENCTVCGRRKGHILRPDFDLAFLAWTNIWIGAMTSVSSICATISYHFFVLNQWRSAQTLQCWASI